MVGQSLIDKYALKSVSPQRVLQIKGGSPLFRETSVILSSLIVIGSIPALPVFLLYLLRQALRKDKDDQENSKMRWKRWLLFISAFVAYVALIVCPLKKRTYLLQKPLWDWWLEYLDVQVAYRGGSALPSRKYVYALMPHGLYPFAGACACISRMVDVFPNMQLAVAPAALRVPILRHLMRWIGCVPVEKKSMQSVLRAGASVGIVPGGIAEMLRTDSSEERLVLQSRKGFIQMALEEGVPLVPVYVFGSSSLCSNIKMPLLELLSRWLRVSLVLPYGRFGMLVPRRIPLLYAIGRPIEPPQIDGKPSPEQIEQTQHMFIEAVKELYDFYKSSYGWENRPLSIE